MRFNTYLPIQHLDRPATISAGGICEFFYAKKEDVFLWPLQNPQTGTYTDEVILRDGASWYRCQVIDSERDYKEESRSSEAGPFVEMQLRGFLPDDSPLNTLTVGAMPYHEYVIVLQERNGIRRLIGSEDAGAKFSHSYDSSDGDGTRGRTLVFTYKSQAPAAIYLSVVTATGEVINPPWPGGGGPELDPTVPQWVKAITQAQILNWNLAYSWGNHATAGYLTEVLADSRYSQLGHTHALSSLSDVTITAPADAQLLRYDIGSGKWVNWTPTFAPGNHTHHFADLLDIPTTIAGYGITDFNSTFDARLNFWKNVPGGVGGLDPVTGKLPTSVLPALATTETFTVASQAEMLALDAQRGDFAVRTDLDPSQVFILAGDDPAILANWISVSVGGIQVINGQSGANVTLTTSHIGEGSNLYFTNARARAALSAGAGISYTAATGVIAANFGTAAGTVAQGNDSRIINGQTAFAWGDHASVGYLITANNGLTKTGSNVSLGGAMTSNVTINAGTNTLSMNRVGSSTNTSSIVLGYGVNDGIQLNAQRVGTGRLAELLIGGAGVVTLRSNANGDAGVSSQIDLNASGITLTGPALLGTNNASAGAYQLLTRNNSTGRIETVNPPSSFGTVSSVALSLPPIFIVSGSPVTTTGTLTGSLASQSANTVFAAPNGIAGAPVFRSLVSDDITSLAWGKITGVPSSFPTTSNLQTVLSNGNTATNSITLGSAGNTNLYPLSILRNVSSLNHTASVGVYGAAAQAGAYIASNNGGDNRLLVLPSAGTAPLYSPDAGANFYTLWHSNNHPAGSAFTMTYTGAEVPATATYNAAGHTTAQTKRNLTASDISAAPASGSGNYIQNISSGIQTANFRIAGHGIFYRDGSNSLNNHVTLLNAAATRGANIQLNGDVNPGFATWIHNGSTWVKRQEYFADGNSFFYGPLTSSSTINSTNSTVNTMLSYSGGGWGISGTSTNHPYALYTNNAERIRITATGDVGIGTTSPASKLHVNGNITAPLLTAPSGSDLSITASSNHSILFNHGGANSGTWDADGRLGIGTTPNALRASLLEVAGNVWATDAYLLGTGSTPVAEFFLTGGDAGVRTMSTQNFVFNTNADTERMRIDGTSGNVLIGTASDNNIDKLQVNGSARVQGFTAGVITTTGNVTVLQAHHTIISKANTGNPIVTLPLASQNLGRIIVLVDEAANLTANMMSFQEITTGNGVLYRGSLYTNCNNPALATFSRLTIQSDGTNWVIISGM